MKINKFRNILISAFVPIIMATGCFHQDDVIEPDAMPLKSLESDERYHVLKIYYLIENYVLQKFSWFKDQRQPAFMNDELTDAMGEVFYKGSFCTGTVSKFKNFNVIGDYDLVSLAAHCLRGDKFEDGLKNQNIRFYGSYLNDKGQVIKFEANNPKVWTSKVSHEMDRTFSETALLAFPKEQIPESITPIEIKTYDLSDSGRKHYNFITYGFSKDRIGLSKHKNCSGLKEGLYFQTNCQVNSGSSGGPLLGKEDLSSRFKIYAVNSHVSIDENTRAWLGITYHSIFFNQDLSRVKFLEPK